jgi:hypothetical protein
VFGASYPSHLVQVIDGNIPERRKLEAAELTSGIVNGTGFAALRADRLTVLARMNDGSNVLVWLAFLFMRNFTEAKGLVICNGIEYSFQEHLGCERKMEVVVNQHFTAFTSGLFLCIFFDDFYNFLDRDNTQPIRSGSGIVSHSWYWESNVVFYNQADKHSTE